MVYSCSISSPCFENFGSDLALSFQHYFLLKEKQLVELQDVFYYTYKQCVQENKFQACVTDKELVELAWSIFFT